MVRGAVLSPELAQTIHRMRQDGMKLAEISPLVGLGISWISEILRGTNAETGKKTNAKKRCLIGLCIFNNAMLSCFAYGVWLIQYFFNR